MTAINGRGIPCFSGSCSEIYREQAFVKRGWGPAERYPVARELGETSLMFLVHPTLDDSAIAHTCRAVAEVMAEAGRR
jgi:dTDP-4-amino-4,6-dideoxygalactose transaminase